MLGPSFSGGSLYIRAGPGLISYAHSLHLFYHHMTFHNTAYTCPFCSDLIMAALIRFQGLWCQESVGLNFSLSVDGQCDLGWVLSTENSTDLIRVS